MHSIKLAVSIGSMAALVFASLACAPVAVTVDAAADANFSRYQTYFNLPSTAALSEKRSEMRSGPSSDEPSGQSNDALQIAQKIQSTIDGLLQEKGYRIASAAEADLAVGFTLDSEETRRRVNAADPDTDFYVDKNFMMNRLMISIAEIGSEEQIWQGTGEVEIRLSGALISDDREGALIRTAREILAKLPRAGTTDRSSN